jgi:hypothetical protein
VSERPSAARALAWAAAITGTEWAIRKATGRRLTAWMVTYAGLGGVAFVLSRGDGVDRPDRTWVSGAVLASVGYPLGRRLAGDFPKGAPTEPALTEGLVIAGVVAPAEELLWGRLVEPALGIGPTAALFAIKHGIVDGRWRRTAGLALFWAGLGLIRRSSPRKAMALHVALNAGGLALGRVTGVDQF